MKDFGEEQGPVGFLYHSSLPQFLEGTQVVQAYSTPSVIPLGPVYTLSRVMLVLLLPPWLLPYHSCKEFTV